MLSDQLSAQKHHPRCAKATVTPATAFFPFLFGGTCLFKWECTARMAVTAESQSLKDSLTQGKKEASNNWSPLNEVVETSGDRAVSVKETGLTSSSMWS